PLLPQAASSPIAKTAASTSAATFFSFFISFSSCLYDVHTLLTKLSPARFIPADADWLMMIPPCGKVHAFRLAE
ncbi:MAG: hypothetical protein IKE94_10620, partial [Aeriscardovia sp.]|nr:hypothetical protein [Aeriscardovia sp.]